MSWADQSIFAKIVVVFAVAFGIGLGLCGLDFLLAAHGIGKSTQEFGVGPLDAVSLWVMFVSGLGLVVTVIVWASWMVIGNLRHGRGGNDPTRLFDDKDR